MKKFLNKNFFEDVIKYLKIFYQNIRGNKLPDLNKIRLPKNYNKIYKKKVLIAVSTGGLSSMLVFESLIGKLLQSKNCEVDYLLCDEILPACVMATVHRIDQSNTVKKRTKKISSYCFVTSNNYLKKSGNNVVRFSELINQDELNQIKKINFEKYTFEDLKNFKFEGINIGEHANSGTIRYFSSSNLKNIKNSKETLIQYVKAALVTQKVSENLFKKKNMMKCLSIMGFMFRRV